jgi:hypothetical protein
MLAKNRIWKQPEASVFILSDLYFQNKMDVKDLMLASPWEHVQLSTWCFNFRDLHKTAINNSIVTDPVHCSCIPKLGYLM